MHPSTFSSRFAINLQEDGEAGCDNVAFHFNARQSEDTVVRNTKDGGDWQEEERDIPYFPFNEGKTFLIKIEVASSLYRVYVNGKHFINYGHKMDMDKVHYLYLTDGAEYFYLFILFIMKFLPTYIYTNTYMRQGLGLGKAYHCPLPSVLQFTFIMKINPTMHNNICHIHFIYTIKSTC